MFRIQKHNEPIKWPVTVSVPVDGGEVKKHEFTAYFRLLPATAEYADDRDFLAQRLVGWDGVQDEGGGELQFSEANRDQLSEITYVKTAIFAAYFECAAGAGRKNSRARRATG